MGENTYGHPRDEILATLAATGAHIARTDRQGQLLVSLREGELALWTEREPP